MGKLPKLRSERIAGMIDTPSLNTTTMKGLKKLIEGINTLLGALNQATWILKLKPNEKIQQWHMLKPSAAAILTACLCGSPHLTWCCFSSSSGIWLCSWWFWFFSLVPWQRSSLFASFHRGNGIEVNGRSLRVEFAHSGGDRERRGDRGDRDRDRDRDRGDRGDRDRGDRRRDDRS